jgi:flotillin
MTQTPNKPSDSVQTLVAQSTEISDPNLLSEQLEASPAWGQLAIGIPLVFVASLLSVWFLKSFLIICKPNEVVVLSGRKSRNKNGQPIGYRVLTGGRTVRIPIIETVKRIDVIPF